MYTCRGFFMRCSVDDKTKNPVVQVIYDLTDFLSEIPFLEPVRQAEWSKHHLMSSCMRNDDAFHTELKTCFHTLIPGRIGKGVSFLERFPLVKSSHSFTHITVYVYNIVHGVGVVLMVT